jgi:hypothetical protein
VAVIVDIAGVPNMRGKLDEERVLFLAMPLLAAVVILVGEIYFSEPVSKVEAPIPNKKAFYLRFG